MKTKVELFDRAGQLVHTDEAEGSPEVIFFGVRAFYSVQPSHGHYIEVSCLRLPEKLMTVGDVALPVAEVINGSE